MALATARYYASAEDLKITESFFELHTIGLPLSIRKCPETDFLYVGALPQSALSYEISET